MNKNSKGVDEMSRSKVFVSRRLIGPAVDLLREHFEVEANEEDLKLSREEFLTKISDKDAVLCNGEKINEETLQRAPNCKVFANHAVGFDNMDLQAGNQYGVWFTNTPDVLTDATADMAWGLLMAVARRIVEADKYNRSKGFAGYNTGFMLGKDIAGRTLGIIGAGRIGQAVARRAKGFNMQILYTAHAPKPEFEAETNAKFVDQNTLLRESDFVSLHVPAMASTMHLIGENELKLMKKSAILINTARGKVVDEKALLAALQSGTIWGAGLDVYENEPQMTPGLAELDNVVLAPHIGSATYQTRCDMALTAANNIIAVLSGKPPLTPVNQPKIKK